MKQGPFPSRAVVLSVPLKRYYGPIRHPAGGTRLHGIAAYTRPPLPEQNNADSGPARASPVPAPTLRPCRSLYPGGFLAAALPGSTRRPWPSPRFPRFGSPLSRERASVTRRQDSLDVAAWPVAPPKGAFDTGLRRRAFPPDAASLLPGALALTGTGLPPAGGCELMFRSGHRDCTTSKHWAHKRSRLVAKQMVPNSSYPTHRANRRPTDGAGNDTETGFLRGRDGSANRIDDLWACAEIFHRLDKVLLGLRGIARLCAPRGMPAPHAAMLHPRFTHVQAAATQSYSQLATRGRTLADMPPAV